MDTNRGYRLRIEGNTLYLGSQSFKAERAGVLHSGVYNREMASTFLSAGLTGAFMVTVVLVFGLKLKAGYYVAGAICFIILYPLCRVFVFGEPVANIVISKDNGSVEVSKKSFLVHKSIKKNLKELRNVKVEHVEFDPPNPDGAAFVAKIALQHGSVIPGFGRPEHYFSVNLDFSDEVVTVFTSGKEEDAVGLAEDVRKFLNSRYQ
ncbi:MAG: hypothetical protein HQK89_12800 [Nitrospirae bacterium]|nr:hypothetical protein [Nitrospirota bacterium]